MCADDVGAGPLEQPLRTRVPARDQAFRRDRHDAVHTGAHDRGELRSGGMGGASLRRVADGSDDEGSLLAGQRGETYVDRELAAVSPPAGEIEPRPHLTRPRRRHVASPIAPVLVPEPLGYEHLDLVAAQSCGLVAEQCFSLLVGRHDGAFVVDHHRRVRRQPEKCLQQLDGEGLFRWNRPVLERGVTLAHDASTAAYVGVPRTTAQLYERGSPAAERGRSLNPTYSPRHDEHRRRAEAQELSGHATQYGTLDTGPHMARHGDHTAGPRHGVEDRPYGIMRIDHRYPCGGNCLLRGLQLGTCLDRSRRGRTRHGFEQLDSAAERRQPRLCHVEQRRPK